jgi:hypothetical protein
VVTEFFSLVNERFYGFFDIEPASITIQVLVILASAAILAAVLSHI